MKKHYAKWLMITLIMAIGIGTFAALTISEKQREENEARPSSYITNQRRHDIDFELLKEMIGEYQASESEDAAAGVNSGEYWKLMISEDFDGKGPYLSVYDQAAGNFGFEGCIMYLRKGIIIVEVDQLQYEKMPFGWELEGEGKYAILDYHLSDESLVLAYRGNEAVFKPEVPVGSRERIDASS